MKKFGIGCLAAIGGLVVLIVIIAIFTSGDSTQTSDDNGTSDSEESSTSSGDESSESSSGSSNEETPTHSIGDTVEVGQVSYTINSMETAQEVGPDMLSTTTEETFIILDVEFTNNGNEAVTVDSNYIKLLSGGSTYEPSSEATTSANSTQNDSTSFFLEEVNPGSSTSGKVVFEVVPELAEASDLQAELQEGFFGSNTAVVNLNQ
ncbi:DUF4352 domain-containing protein [Salibacterium qingdaonense]|uniref:DUF4352 domain-containing protein n=1 Tax=Salibacterium qingdaonense TaxID=266892 RepID=A0A1I4KQ46_9BACI|nr:DUF4352 domain-containing protein [Salibacterium qingdaonense]SFL80679.1 protein of unknown function [Salibacterium qingdaonense]